MQLNDKTVLLTGGTDGIGKALALQLQAHGAQVLIVGRNPARCASMRQIGFTVIEADLAAPTGYAALIDAIARQASPIDILINNAGIYEEQTPAGFSAISSADYLLTLNLLRPIALISALLPSLSTRAEAMIVNVTSGLAIAPNDHAAYCASKAGLRAYTMSLRHQLKGTGVHVLEALPPLVDTQMNADKSGKKMSADACAKRIVQGMRAQADEVNIGDVGLLRVIYSASPALARKIMITS
jgi:uncharacterized oxidoreductase